MRRRLFPLLEIRMYLRTVIQVIPDHRVHIGEREGGILLRDRFWGRTITERHDDRIKRDAGVPHAYDPVGVSGEGNGLIRHDKRHIVLLSDKALCLLYQVGTD